MVGSTNRNPAIVLVEDEPDILIILHRLMRDLTANYDIITVNGGAEALVQLELRRVPLLITDYNTPGMNGIQLTEAVKTAHPATRVALITAYATPGLERKAQDAGVDYYLPKPFPLDRLETIVREACGGANRSPQAPNLYAGSDNPEAIGQDLYVTANWHYQKAGAPYGDGYLGLVRWVDEQLSRHS